MDCVQCSSRFDGWDGNAMHVYTVLHGADTRRYIHVKTQINLLKQWKNNNSLLSLPDSEILLGMHLSHHYGRAGLCSPLCLARKAATPLLRCCTSALPRSSRKWQQIRARWHQKLKWLRYGVRSGMMLACIAKEEFETEMEMEHAIALKTARHEHNQFIYTYHYYISTLFKFW